VWKNKTLKEIKNSISDDGDDHNNNNNNDGDYGNEHNLYTDL
jgi:hypothetical protein